MASAVTASKSASSLSNPKSPDPPHSATSSTIRETISHKRLVSAVPPWAADEPPSKEEEEYLRVSSAIGSGNDSGHLAQSSSHERTPSDIGSVTSSDPPDQNSWWTFTGHRLKPHRGESQHASEHRPDPAAHDLHGENGWNRRIPRIRPQMKNRSPWLFGSRRNTLDDKEANGNRNLPEDNEDHTSSDEDEEEQEEEEREERNAEELEEERDHFDEAGPSSTSAPGTISARRRRGLGRRVSTNVLRLDMPLAPAPFTKAQTETPGWDSPWNPHRFLAQPDEAHIPDGSTPMPNGMLRQDSTFSTRSGKTGRRRKGSKWKRRTKNMRKYCLHNLYVPLIFRIINLAFTSATLGVAVRIRRLERDNDVLGILGSSSTLTIIFGPITLVHVIFAIWSEYFGRPLGLWKTSWKLSYTLLEISLICAWSAALSLCFNDFLTSELRCAPRSVNDWWNSLPAYSNPLDNKMREGQAGGALCDSQIALICLAYVTLLSYCSNLVISLFRIIEKVKFHDNRKTWDAY
ncbi:hypothetical protein FRB96_000350 [Tulasnella sp. 330]|nr:hypothetical protein FRB96_000350 [Tulasnella sp. 330]KAG8885020.1 hypothetical protein FRB97_002527 [Tulasnella sp. 331]KAG8890907.1 hypothetical protein FRB98_002927 [Tulasnella sp. 332]